MSFLELPQADTHSMATSLVVFCFAEREGNVAVFDHVLYLSPHGETEQNYD
jgi:hypothetical protein